MTRQVLIFLATMNLSLAFSQETDRFYNMTRRDGLGSGSITAIVQDQQGLIWLGTKKGLDRYDGSEFVHYHSGNSQITSNDVSSLCIDDQNQLWVGTFGSGLHQMTLSNNEIEKVANEKIGSRIIDIRFKRNMGLWVLSDQGLNRLDSVNISAIEQINRTLGNSGSALTLTNRDLWVGNNQGSLINLGSKGKLSTYSLKSHAANIWIQKIHPMRDNTLLIGTRQHGLLSLDLTSRTIKKINIAAVDIRDIIEDAQGSLWVGTDGHGIYKISEDGSIKQLINQPTKPFSLVSNAVESCFEDRDQNLWFGTAWDGLSFLDHRHGNIAFYFSDFKGVKRSGVLGIFKESNNLWFGTDGFGLSAQHINNHSANIINQIPENVYVQCIKKHNDKYWIGTFQSGLFIIDSSPAGSYTQITTVDGLSHDDVRQIIPLDSNQYLIATWGGGLNIYNIRTKELKQVPYGKKDPKDIVTICRLDEENILIGTFGQGLFTFNQQNFSYQRVLQNLNNVVSIKAVQDRIWIGTWGQGLHYTDRKLSESIMISNEMLDAHANIVSMLPVNGDKEVWLSTTERVFKVTESAIQELPFAPQQYHINSAFQSNGVLYFGGTDGVISFRPDHITLEQPKPIEILNIKVLDKSIETSFDRQGSVARIAFEHDENMFTFNYATPSYPVSRDEKYEAKLEPLQGSWVNVGSQRAMTFVDLNPGDYEFWVRNIASKSEQSFQFTILRPWWKTWWAYLIATTLFLSLLYIFRKYAINLERIKNQLDIERIGREKELEISNIKQRFFVNVSHEIRTPLTLIIGEIEQLTHKANTSKALSASLSNLRNNGNHLIQLVNELLDFRKLDQGGMRLKVAQGNFVNFCREIFLSFLNKAEAQGIIYQFVCEEDDIPLWFDRDQLEKVFYNLLSNAFKNTPRGGAIQFIIEQNQEGVKVTIADTGHGISEESLKTVFKRFYQKDNDPSADTPGYGIGLSIVEEITKLHHGNVHVKSVEHEGSQFFVALKKGKAHFREENLLHPFVNSEVIDSYQSATPTKDAGSQKSDNHILIVEDNADIRELLITSLSGRFTTSEAANGKEALSLIQDTLPDLIVSDVMMPELDGISLTQKLKKDTFTSHIPIILLTARTATIFKKEGYETGADDYITKPFSPSLLLTRIDNILESRENLKKHIRNELATRPNDLNLASPDEQFLKNLVSIVENHLDNSELNAELVAMEMGMSHSVVYKKIKALTGFNLVEFIRDYRLQQAGQMLTKYKLSIAETCYKVGFSDKKYFSQIFKKKFGVTPSQYTKKEP